MNKKVVYKSREEILLIKELVLSSFITEKQLLDIKSYYNENVPYHNFLHALTVASKVLELLSPKDYNVIEIKSLFLAALFHDAGHTGMAEDLDEFRSLDIALNAIEIFEKEYEYTGIDNSIIRKAIIGTVFKNRGTNTNKYAIIMADLDIHTIGEDFVYFLYYSDFGMMLEIGEDISGKNQIKSWFKNIGYFKFLMFINKNIFLNNKIQKKLLQKSLENISEYINISKNNFKFKNGKDILEIFNYWKNNDITYKEFYSYIYK